MPRPADLRVAHVVTRYGDTVRAVRARVLAYVSATWGGLGAYRDADIARFVDRVVPVVAGGQRQVAALTDTYLAAVETQVLGVARRPVGISPRLVTTEALRGVPASTVYTRPGVTVWAALANGVNLDDAIGQGLTRALSIAATDLQLARTTAAQTILAGNERVHSYRRVPGGGNTCDLCLLAADNHYWRGDLMPIHPGCYCGVEPVFYGADPGIVVEPDTPELDPTATTDVVVHEHGELGPVLAAAGQQFTGPDDF